MFTAIQMLILYLSKIPKVLPDSFFCCFWVQPTNKDFLDWLLLHGHGFLGVNLPPIEPMFLLCKHLAKNKKPEAWQSAFINSELSVGVV